MRVTRAWNPRSLSQQPFSWGHLWDSAVAHWEAGHCWHLQPHQLSGPPPSSHHQQGVLHSSGPLLQVRSVEHIKPTLTTLSFGGTSLSLALPGSGTAAERAALPIPISMQYFHVSKQTMVWLLVFWIFNMHAAVHACDCAWGLYGHCKSLHWKWTLGDKILCFSGESNLCQYSAWLFSWTLYQLSYSCPRDWHKGMNNQTMKFPKIN